MGLWDGLSSNIQNTSLAKALSAGLQQFGYNRQQDVPLFQGGAGNSTFGAMATGLVGPRQVYAADNPPTSSDVNSSSIPASFNPPASFGTSGNTPTQTTQTKPAPSDPNAQVNSGDYGDPNPGMKTWQQILAETGGSGMYQNAQAEKASYLASIQRRLDEARRLASQKKSRAQEEYDYTQNMINPQIDTLLKRNSEQKANADVALNQEGTTLENIYNKAIGSARKRASSIELQNRNRARAMNRLDSSYYGDIQNANLEDSKAALDTIDTEKAGKVTDLGRRKTETGQFYANQATDIETQRTSLQRDAYKEYQAALDEADALDKAGVMDYQDGEAAAQQQFSSRLTAIDNYVAGIAQKKLQLSTLAKTGGSSLDTQAALDALIKGAYTTDNPGIDTANSKLDNTAQVAPSTTLSSVNDFVTNLLSRYQQKKPQLAYATYT